MPLPLSVVRQSIDQQEKADMPMRPVLREVGSEDRMVLEKILYEAISIPPGTAPIDPALILTPELKRYYEGWMRPGDAGIIAQSNQHTLGASGL